MTKITRISRNSKSSSYVKNEFVQPIRTHQERMMFKHWWLGPHCIKRSGRKNWTIFCVGIVTALRASDIVKLQMWQVYASNGIPRQRVISEIDKKTHKLNRFLDIKSLRACLIKYRRWRKSRGIHSEWLFPRQSHLSKHITSDYIYKMMSQTGDRLGIHHMGSQSLRKTFGYIAYEQTHDIVYVMKRLNHSNPAVTLRYIGLDSKVMNRITDSLHFDL